MGDSEESDAIQKKAKDLGAEARREKGFYFFWLLRPAVLLTYEVDR
jgi:hypothetical protein